MAPQPLQPPRSPGANACVSEEAPPPQDGSLNRHAVHCACPVASGQKWILQVGPAGPPGGSGAEQLLRPLLLSHGELCGDALLLDRVFASYV